MKKTITIIFIISFNYTSFACKCPKFWNKWNEQKVVDVIESSDIIFIGKLKIVADDCYKFEVINAFKGDIKRGELVDGYYLTSCSGRPYGNGKWIFYGKYYQASNNNLVLHYSQCSPTRNLTRISKKRNHEYWERELKLLNICFDTNITTN